MKQLLIFLISVFLIFYSSGQEDKTSSSNSTITISDTDNSYSVRAKFNENKSAKIERVVKEYFGNPNQQEGSFSIWERGEIYTIRLKKNRLHVEFDKEDADKSLKSKFKNFDVDLQDALGIPASTSVPPIPPKPLRVPKPPKPPKVPNAPKVSEFHFKFNDKDFAYSMENFDAQMKDFNLEMEDFNLEMEDFDKEMKDFDVEMKDFDKEIIIEEDNKKSIEEKKSSETNSDKEKSTAYNFKV